MMACEDHDLDVLVQMVRGFPFPNSKWFTPKDIEDAMDHEPKDGDVIVASYPKTGTTWLQYIVMQIISRGTSFPSFDDATYKVAPYMEMAGIAAVEALAEPRTYKHHMPYNMVKKSDKSKTIYSYRHPEDTFVSYYHFFQNLEPGISFDFNKFFNMYITGKLSYGCYFKHVLSFYEHIEDSNLLMVSYEKLHSCRKQEILRIAKFISEECYIYLIEQDGILDKIIERTSFEYMKHHLYLTHPYSKIINGNNDGTVVEENKVDFFRKGIVGEGKHVLTKEQQERVKEAAVATLQGTSIIQEWYAGCN